MDNNKVKKHKNSKSGTPSPSSKPNAEPLTSNSNSDLNSDPISNQFPTNSGSQVPLTPKQTDLDNPLQILPDETLQSASLVRFVEGLVSKFDFVMDFCKEMKIISAQNTETLKLHDIALKTSATNLDKLYEIQTIKQNNQTLEINKLKESNSTLVQNNLDQALRITQLEKTVEALSNTTEKLTTRNQILQASIDDLATLKQQVVTQSEQIETLYNDPPNKPPETIQQQVQEHTNTLNTQQFWQGELDKSVNQLVFKNLRKTPNTTNMHPKKIFIDNILAPMNLNNEDKSKVIPISVFDANKGKDTANTHILICTFPNRHAISLIKQNAKNIPKPVRFCPKVPLQYTTTLNEFLKTQGQIRLLRDKDGKPLAKTKITTNKGHLVLEKSDRVKDSFSPFYPIDSFIPQTNGRVPSIIPTPYQKSHALIQCRWDGPISTTSKEAIKAHLEKAKMEYASFKSFNHTSHLLNISTMSNVLEQTLEYLRSNPIFNASKVNSSAF